MALRGLPGVGATDRSRLVGDGALRVDRCRGMRPLRRRLRRHVLDGVRTDPGAPRAGCWHRSQHGGASRRRDVVGADLRDQPLGSLGGGRSAPCRRRDHDWHDDACSRSGVRRRTVGELLAPSWSQTGRRGSTRVFGVRFWGKRRMKGSRHPLAGPPAGIGTGTSGATDRICGLSSTACAGRPAAARAALRWSEAEATRCGRTHVTPRSGPRADGRSPAPASPVQSLVPRSRRRWPLGSGRRPWSAPATCNGPWTSAMTPTAPSQAAEITDG